MNFIKRLNNVIQKGLYKITQRDPISGIKVIKKNVIKLGSDYGGWVIPSDLVNSDSVCYMIGAGEDISFDIEVYNRYKCKVLTIDPTPKAILHYNKVSSTSKNIGITFLPIGVWKEDTVLKFYSPENPSHVSHSILNIQKTTNYFEAEVKKLSTIMRESGDAEITMLKIDIEGAEYEVINNFLNENIFPKVLCVEFDEVFNAIDANYKERINKTINKILVNGYELFYLDFPGNYSFIHKEGK